MADAIPYEYRMDSMGAEERAMTGNGRDFSAAISACRNRLG